MFHFYPKHKYIPLAHGMVSEVAQGSSVSGDQVRIEILWTRWPIVSISEHEGEPHCWALRGKESLWVEVVELPTSCISWRQR